MVAEWVTPYDRVTCTVQINRKLIMGTQQQWFFRQVTLPHGGQPGLGRLHSQTLEDEQVIRHKCTVGGCFSRIRMLARLELRLYGRSLDAWTYGRAKGPSMK